MHNLIQYSTIVNDNEIYKRKTADLVAKSRDKCSDCYNNISTKIEHHFSYENVYVHITVM